VSPSVGPGNRLLGLFKLMLDKMLDQGPMVIYPPNRIDLTSKSWSNQLGNTPIG
jgi:hypothetical protein